jgi:hypothetical protein
MLQHKFRLGQLARDLNAFGNGALAARRHRLDDGIDFGSGKCLGVKTLDPLMPSD